MGKRGRHPAVVIMERRKAVLFHWRKHTAVEIAKILDKAKYGSPSVRTVESDIARHKKAIVEIATDQIGDAKVALADFVMKSLDLRERAVFDGRPAALALAHQIDKDLLKICGINLDRIEVEMLAIGGNAAVDLTFKDLLNSIRDDKQLPPVTEDEV